MISNREQNKDKIVHLDNFQPNIANFNPTTLTAKHVDRMAKLTTNKKKKQMSAYSDDEQDIEEELLMGISGSNEDDDDDENLKVNIEEFR